MALNLSLTTLYISFDMLETPHINEDTISERILSVDTDDHYASLPFLFEQMAIDCHSVLHHNRFASAQNLLIDTLTGNTASPALDYMIRCKNKHMRYLERQLSYQQYDGMPSIIYKKYQREHLATQRLFAEQHSLLTATEFDFLYDLATYTDHILRKDHGIRHNTSAPRM